MQSESWAEPEHHDAWFMMHWIRIMIEWIWIWFMVIIFFSENSDYPFCYGAHYTLRRGTSMVPVEVSWKVPVPVMHIAHHYQVKIIFLVTGRIKSIELDSMISIRLNFNSESGNHVPVSSAVCTGTGTIVLDTCDIHAQQPGFDPFELWSLHRYRYQYQYLLNRAADSAMRTKLCNCRAVLVTLVTLLVARHSVHVHEVAKRD